MTFNDLWPTLPIPGEYDAMDECDKARWRGVIELAYGAGADGAARIERPVRPQSGDRMPVHEAERLVALWCAGQPIDDLPQWRSAMQALARELADTRG